jgi:hypothetical protein
VSALSGLELVTAASVPDVRNRGWIFHLLTLPPARFGPYFIEPVIAGITGPNSSEPNKPFIAAADLIGCLNFAKDFVVAGTAVSDAARGA